MLGNASKGSLKEAGLARYSLLSTTICRVNSAPSPSKDLNLYRLVGCPSGSHRTSIALASLPHRLRPAPLRLHRVERRPDALAAVPLAPRGGLRILRRPRLEEVRVLHAAQHGLQPGQRVFLRAVDLRQLKLPQAPVGDEADVGLDVGRGHALDLAGLEGQVDELVLQADHRLAAVDDVV